MMGVIVQIIEEIVCVHLVCRCVDACFLDNETLGLVMLQLLPCLQAISLSESLGIERNINCCTIVPKHVCYLQTCCLRWWSTFA